MQKVLDSSLFYLSLVAFVALSFGLVSEIPTPDHILRCYFYKSQNASIADLSARSVQEFCIKKYNVEVQTEKENYSRNLSSSGIRYLQSLFRQVESEAFEFEKKNQKRRHKRQLRIGGWRHRREIRTLSNAERNRFFACLIRLKRDRSVDPNMNTYDLIGALHSGRSAELMHNGPGFLGRHMLYLLVLETACRTPIPYWDVTMDAEMSNPISSVIWSDAFFGPGNGPVRRGPFGNWITTVGTPIIRNIGAGGVMLPRKTQIRAMLSRVRTAEITEPQPRMSVFSIEVHHNAIHNFIDGHMAGLNSSPWDPIFWCVHSFFQLLWMAFKSGQRTRGIDPQRDYPAGQNVPRGHEAFQRMNFMPFFSPITNLQSFSDRYDRMVSYSPMPQCPCGSRYLICLRGVCVSRALRRRMIRPFGFIGRRKRSISPQSPKNSLPENVTSLMQTAEAALSTLDNSYQNMFVIDGKVDTSNWAYLPVRVLYERPKGFNFHTESPEVKNGKDMYDPQNYVNASRKMGIQDQVDYSKQCRPTGSGAAKVFVQSDGLSYIGKYKDYAIVDERQPVTSAMSYVGIRKPTDISSEILLTAYDTCGRSCRPACPVHGRYPVVYKACSGSFKVSNKYPLMYSSSYGSAVAAGWNINLEGKGPLFRGGTSPITFVCDHRKTWPWSFSLN